MITYKGFLCLFAASGSLSRQISFGKTTVAGSTARSRGAGWLCFLFYIFTNIRFSNCHYRKTCWLLHLAIQSAYQWLQWNHRLRPAQRRANNLDQYYCCRLRGRGLRSILR
uniref:Putative secreted protein n=1 Tax=Anopheles triannulatus TaxID=58253 RepID=A0A2M4B6P0_9DIPT